MVWRPIKRQQYEFSGCSNGNTSANLRIAGNSTENKISTYHTSISNRNNGTRDVINGKEYIGGDPSAGNGAWAGHEALAHRQNVIVYNGTTDLKIPYFAEENGLWVAI